jgi:hypothetical protein
LLRLIRNTASKNLLGYVSGLDPKAFGQAAD